MADVDGAEAALRRAVAAAPAHVPSLFNSAFLLETARCVAGLCACACACARVRARLFVRACACARVRERARENAHGGP